jgi:WD40 repeat protein
VHENLERRLAAARERVGELSRGLGRDNLDAWRAAREDQLKAERDLASARGEQYAQVIDIGPRWDAGAPLPHLISNGSRAFVVCLASTPTNAGVWEVATGRLVATEPVAELGSLAFSPDGRLLAVGDGDRVMLREVDHPGNALSTDLPDLTVNMRQASNWGVAFSPDGTLLAAAVSKPGRTGSVHLWSVPDFQPLTKYPTHKGLVGLAISPAGDVIATVEDLKSVKLWAAGSGLSAGTVNSPATCLAFSPDGSYLAAGCTDEIHVWTPP